MPSLERGSWRDSGTVCSPTRRECTPARHCTIFLARGPTLRPASCRSRKMQALLGERLLRALPPRGAPWRGRVVGCSQPSQAASTPHPAQIHGRDRCAPWPPWPYLALRSMADSARELRQQVCDGTGCRLRQQVPVVPPACCNLARARATSCWVLDTALQGMSSHNQPYPVRDTCIGYLGASAVQRLLSAFTGERGRGLTAPVRTRKDRPKRAPNHQAATA